MEVSWTYSFDNYVIGNVNSTFLQKQSLKYHYYKNYDPKDSNC